MRLGEGPVDQQRLGRAADAGAAHLGVDDDRRGHVEVGGRVDIDVADAFEMGEDRHPRLGLHARDEALAAARHDDVDGAVEAGSIAPTAARSVVGTSWIAASGRPAARRPATQAGMDGARGVEALRAAAQDGGVAGLQAERAGIGGDVRPALEDHADDAERRAHALDVQAVGRVPLGDHRPTGSGRAAIARRPSPCRDALLVERQAVEEGAGHALGLRPASTSRALAARMAVAARDRCVVGRRSAARHSCASRRGERACGGAPRAPAADVAHQAAGHRLRAGSRMRSSLPAPPRPAVSTMSSRWIISARPR